MYSWKKQITLKEKKSLLICAKRMHFTEYEIESNKSGT